MVRIVIEWARKGIHTQSSNLVLILLASFAFVKKYNTTEVSTTTCILSRCFHERNIDLCVLFLQLFEDESAFYIVTEVCKGGDLRQELINSGLYSEKRAALLMKQVLVCVEYFHSKHIVHR